MFRFVSFGNSVPFENFESSKKNDEKNNNKNAFGPRSRRDTKKIHRRPECLDRDTDCHKQAHLQSDRRVDATIVLAKRPEQTESIIGEDLFSKADSAKICLLDFPTPLGLVGYDGRIALSIVCHPAVSGSSYAENSDRSCAALTLDALESDDTTIE